MKILKKITALALSLIMAAATAFTSYAGGLEPIKLNGIYYIWKTPLVLFAADSGGNVIYTGNGLPDSEFDPAQYINKLPELEYIGVKTVNKANAKLYSCGNGVILAVFAADINGYADGKYLREKYPDAVFYEGTVFYISGLIKIGGKTYFQDENGKKVIGWREISGLKAYFNKKGEMVKKDTVIDGIRYKFGKDGWCRGRYTGWTRSSKGRKYWDDGRLVKNKWIKKNGSKYRAGGDGYLLTGRAVIDGVEYEFDENGALIP